MRPHIKARLENTGRAAAAAAVAAAFGCRRGIIKRRLHPLCSVLHTHIYSLVVSRNSLKIPTAAREKRQIIYLCPFYLQT